MKGLIYSLVLMPLFVSCGGKLDELDLQSLSTNDEPEGVITKISTVGTLDTSFGSGSGYVVTGSGTGDDDMNASAVDSDGKIIVVGSVDNGVSSGIDMAVWRFNTDGTLDTSFGGTGLVTYTGSGAFSDVAYAVSIDDEGRVVVAGLIGKSSTDSDMAVWRITTSGSLDTNFAGGDGVFSHDGAGGVTGEQEFAKGVEVDSVGKILVGGSADTVSGSQWTPEAVVWRLNADGTLDLAFNGVGYVGGISGEVNSFAVTSEGDILVGGFTGIMKETLNVWKYTSTGAIDTSFGGGDGIVEYDPSAGFVFDASYALTLDKNENIVVVGETGNDMTILRYTPSGVLDTSFGTGGVVTHDVNGGTSDVGRAVIIDHEDNILIAGKSDNSTDDDMVIWKFESSGVIDTSFASGVGYMTIDGTAGGGDDEALGISFDEVGNILVSGRSFNGSDHDAVIWRIK